MDGDYSYRQNSCMHIELYAAAIRGKWNKSNSSSDSPFNADPDAKLAAQTNAPPLNQKHLRRVLGARFSSAAACRLIVRPSSPLADFSVRRISSGSRRTHDERRRPLAKYTDADGGVSAPLPPPAIASAAASAACCSRSWNDERREPGSDREKSLPSWYTSTSSVSDCDEPRREPPAQAWSGCSSDWPSPIESTSSEIDRYRWWSRGDRGCMRPPPPPPCSTLNELRGDTFGDRLANMEAARRLCGSSRRYHIAWSSRNAFCRSTRHSPMYTDSVCGARSHSDTSMQRSISVSGRMLLNVMVEFQMGLRLGADTSVWIGSLWVLCENEEHADKGDRWSNESVCRGLRQDVDFGECLGQIAESHAVVARHQIVGGHQRNDQLQAIAVVPNLQLNASGDRSLAGQLFLCADESKAINMCVCVWSACQAIGESGSQRGRRRVHECRSVCMFNAMYSNYSWKG